MLGSTPLLNPLLQGFQCLRCDSKFPIRDLFEGCTFCAKRGHASSVIASYAPEATKPHQRLPILAAPQLGEGNTPLIRLPKIAAELEMEDLWLKAEYQNPTGSHKDRMAAQIVGRALTLDSPRVVAASTGNAGVALAAYCARAGLPCTIFTQTGISGTWRRDMAAFGAEVVVVSTSMERWERIAEIVKAGNGYPATNYLTPPVGSNPFGVQGYKSVGHELGAALRETPPDAILVPTSRGDLLWGIWEGLREAWADLEPPIWPKMVATEPFARASKVLAGADYRDAFPGKTNQFAIASPSVTWQTVHTLQASQGLAPDIGDPAAAAARIELLHQGFALERCAAASLVALREIRNAGILPPGSRAVLIGTSDGRREDPLSAAPAELS